MNHEGNPIEGVNVDVSVKHPNWGPCVTGNVADREGRAIQV